MSAKIAVTRHELAWAVENAIKFVEKSPTVPEFHNYVIRGDGDELKIIAASRPCYAEFNVPYKGDKVFFGINAALFTQMILKNMDSVFDILVYDDEIVIQKDRKKMKLAITFPTFDMINTQEAELEALHTEHLKKAVDTVKGCVAPKKAVMQEQFRHIYLDNEDGKLVAVATDGFRMAVSYTDIPFNGTFIANTPCLSNAVNILSSIKEASEIGMHGESLQLRHDYCSFIFTPYHGKYANWRGIVKINLDNVAGWIELHTYDFKQCLDRLKILNVAMVNYTPIFTVGASTLFVKIEGDVQYEERMQANITGNVAPFRLDPVLVYDIVNPLTCDTIVLGVPKDGNGAVAIKPVDDEMRIAFCGTSIR